MFAVALARRLGAALARGRRTCAATAPRATSSRATTCGSISRCDATGRAAADARRARAARTPRRAPRRAHRVGRQRFAGGYELRAVPRGRYAFETVRLTIEDPFGLARAELVQGEPQALVVYPRLVALDRLFSEGGAHAQDGRRLLLRRPTGYELHSVREYVEGESLRRRTAASARRSISTAQP